MAPAFLESARPASWRADPIDVARKWSRAIHDHPAVLDGIAYRSKHDDDEVCIALFDRARDRVAAAGVPQPMMMDLLRLAELFARYGLALGRDWS